VLNPGARGARRALWAREHQQQQQQQRATAAQPTQPTHSPLAMASFLDCRCSRSESRGGLQNPLTNRGRSIASRVRSRCAAVGASTTVPLGTAARSDAYRGTQPTPGLCAVARRAAAAAAAAVRVPPIPVRGEARQQRRRRHQQQRVAEKTRSADQPRLKIVATRGRAVRHTARARRPRRRWSSREASMDRCSGARSGPPSPRRRRGSTGVRSETVSSVSCVRMTRRSCDGRVSLAGFAASG